MASKPQPKKADRSNGGAASRSESSTVSSAILVADKIGRILDGDHDPRERMARVVTQLKRATQTDVCTIYRVAPGTGALHIEATDGLSKALIGAQTLKRGQGLTGLVVSRRKAVAVRDGPSHPAFLYVPGLREERMHSFLGVPIMDGRRVRGALVLQTQDPRDFPREEIALLGTVARQIAPTCVKFFAGIERKSATAAKKVPPAPKTRELIGRSLSPGFYSGRPRLIDHGLDLETITTPPSRGVDVELTALRRATGKVAADLRRDARQISGSEAEAILIAHKVILEDKSLNREVIDLVRKGASAAEAIRATAAHWAGKLQALSDPIFAARAHDFRDIANRFLQALGIEAVRPNVGEGGKAVVLARMLLPGDLLRLGPARIGAVILTDQGIYSHTAIIVRSFNIPAIQIDPIHLEQLAKAKSLAVDGGAGLVLADPAPRQIKEMMASAEATASLPEGGPTDLSGPVETLDHVPLHIGLNAGLEGDFDQIRSVGPESIGLFRTELRYMSNATLPTLKAQTAHYRRILDLAGGRRVVFRTFDFGGDKVPECLRFDREDNPMMGHRSTRYMLDHIEILRTQLRALITVSAHGPMAILLPMITMPEEANLILDEINGIRNELDREGVPFNRKLEIGVMIEVPSVLFVIDELSRVADFFCVGTNDLVQYLMAADRSNSRVARLYQWHHPAVLVALARLMRHCKRNRRPVTICGEMASHPWAALLLAGMGYTDLSIERQAIGTIKWTLRQTSAQKMKLLARQVTHATSSTEVIELLFEALEEIQEEAPPLGRLLAGSLERLRANSAA